MEIRAMADRQTVAAILFERDVTSEVVIASEAKQSRVSLRHGPA
jgi:hypothetical protein